MVTAQYSAHRVLNPDGHGASDALSISQIDRSTSASEITNGLKINRQQSGKGGPPPIFLTEFLSNYKYDSQLGRNELVVSAIKTTLQVHKNDRQEEQLKRTNPDVFGREAARQYVQGLVAAFSLSHDRLDWSLAESEWAFTALEPYSVDVWGDMMALSGANYVWLVNLNTGALVPCRHPWLSQAHTAQFSADGTRLLVASAGFDAIFEFDTQNGNLAWEWFAWEHGFEQSPLGHYVVRSAERRDTLTALGKAVLFVDDPEKYEFGIPTRQSPTHLNCACYDNNGNILVTLFHQGAGIVIDKGTGNVRNLITDLVNPHKLARRRRGGYFVSDTRRGKLVFMNDNGLRTSEITLTGMPGLERSDLLSEFLQNTTEIKRDLFASVDIHRNSLWLIDVKRRRYRGIKFPLEWSMHEVTSIGREHCRRIGNLVGTTFGKVHAVAQENKLIRHFSPHGDEIARSILDNAGRHRELDFEM